MHSKNIADESGKQLIWLVSSTSYGSDDESLCVCIPINIQRTWNAGLANL